MFANWKLLVAAFLYPVIFEREPRKKVRKVIERLKSDLPQFTRHRADFIKALEIALKSDEPLLEIIPQNHLTEKALRRYLETMYHALAPERPVPHLKRK